MCVWHDNHECQTCHGPVRRAASPWRAAAYVFCTHLNPGGVTNVSVRSQMNCSVGQLYWVFSVKTLTFASLVGLLECNGFCCSLHPQCFFLILIQSWERWPFLRRVQFFVSMKCLYEYRIHIHTQSYFHLNSFVHSVLNKCLNINVAVCYLTAESNKHFGLNGNILQRITGNWTLWKHLCNMQYIH